MKPEQIKAERERFETVLRDMESMSRDKGISDERAAGYYDAAKLVQEALDASPEPARGEPVAMPEGFPWDAEVRRCLSEQLRAASLMSLHLKYTDIANASLAIAEWLDQSPEPAEKELQRARDSRDFYKSRVDLLQQVQPRMREPERTLVCDVLANGQLLPDPSGERYGVPQPAPAAPEPVAIDIEQERKEFEALCRKEGVGTKRYTRHNSWHSVGEYQDYGARFAWKAWLACGQKAGPPMPALPPGWVPVPVEPTEAMYQQGREVARSYLPKHGMLEATFRAMVKAAPPCPAVTLPDGWPWHATIRERIAGYLRDEADDDDRHDPECGIFAEPELADLKRWLVRWLDQSPEQGGQG